jgi:hypothetical protein
MFETILNSDFVTEEILSHKTNEYDGTFIVTCSLNSIDLCDICDIFDIFLTSSKCTSKVLGVTDGDGRNCLHITIENRSISDVLKLLDHCAVTDELILSTDNDGDNILSCLKFESENDIQFFKHPKIQKNLHILLQPVTNKSWHPCMIICKYAPTCFKYLVETKHINKNIIDIAFSDNWSYLTVSAKRTPMLLQYLLDTKLFSDKLISLQCDPYDESKIENDDQLVDLNSNSKLHIIKGGQTFLHFLACFHPNVFVTILATNTQLYNILHILDNSNKTCFDYLKYALDNIKDLPTCNICYEKKELVAMHCGHTCCEICVTKLNECHYCKNSCENHIKLYI